MNNEKKTKPPFFKELNALQSRLAEIEVIETEHGKSQQELEKPIKEIEERVKELKFLYATFGLLKEAEVSINETLQRAADILLLSLHHPENCCARITVEGMTFETRNFRESHRKLYCDIVVHGNPVGSLEFFCHEEKPEASLLKEENQRIAVVCRFLERIIERKQTEKALLESEKRFQSLMENSPIGILIVQEGQIIYENPVEKKLSGPLAQFFRHGKLEDIHPDDFEKVEKGFQKITSGEVKSLDMDFRFYPGGKEDNAHEMIWVHCWASLIEYLGKEAILVNKLDVTRAKEMEHLLRIEDKMASLGRVASGIAHEIRSPLSGINIFLNNLQKILQEAKSQDKVKEIIRQIRSASSKIEAVIRRVMDFAKPSEPRFILTDLHQPIKEAIDLSAVALRMSGISLNKSLAKTLPPCQADPHLIGQVILNLISNAAEAMKSVEEAKQIEVTTSVKDGRIIVSISDSGPGVPFHLRKKIFDPFFTTKNGSTGIGLSLCQRIITDHGGSLNVLTSKWGGAEFRVEIPIKIKRERKQA